MPDTMNDSLSSSPSKTSNPMDVVAQGERKVWKAPSVRVLGDVAELTRNGAGGTEDGFGPGNGS